MMNSPKKLLWGSTLAILLVAGWQMAWAADAQTTLHGYVLDSACAFTKNLQKPTSAECAVACAKAGSPLVILADDHNIYLPISASTPAHGQNERLMEFAGKKVSVTGSVYRRGGAYAIVIATIEASK